RARMSPARTTCPSCTSIERTMEVSSGCTTSVVAWDTTLPLAVMTLSIGIRPIAMTHDANIAVIIQITPLADAGIGAVTMAADGDWNSRIAGITARSSRVGTRLVEVF